MSSLFNVNVLNISNLSIIFIWISLISIYITNCEAKCQIVCNKWADDTFHRCDDAEVKCASNLPQGYYCSEFSNTRPVKCLSMILEDEMHSAIPSSGSAASKSGSPLRPQRHRRPFVDYRVDQAPIVELLPEA